MPHHKLTVIGRLVSDPKDNTFANGRVAKFGLPIDFSRRKKNPQTGEWEGDSFIINVDAFNRENFKLADHIMTYLKKGSQVYVEGRLKNNEYTDKNGVKVSRPVLIADIVEFLDRPGEGGGMGGSMDGGYEQPVSRSRPPAATPPPNRQQSRPQPQNSYYEEEDMSPPPGKGGGDDDIPF